MDSMGYSLYVEPSFGEGVARLVDMTGVLNEYNYSRSAEEADYRAIASDWEAVGLDIWTAIGLFRADSGKRASNDRRE